LKVQDQIPGRRIVEERRREGEHIVKLPRVSRAGRFPVVTVTVPSNTSVLFVPRFPAKVVLSPATERLVVEA